MRLRECISCGFGIVPGTSAYVEHCVYCLEEMEMTIKCDTCKAVVPEDHVADCTVYVGGPEDRDSVHLCQKCFDEHEAEREVEARHWFAVYQAEKDATLWERDPAEYRRQMREAGRGHLVREP